MDGTRCVERDRRDCVQAQPQCGDAGHRPGSTTSRSKTTGTPACAGQRLHALAEVRRAQPVLQSHQAIASAAISTSSATSTNLIQRDMRALCPRTRAGRSRYDRRLAATA